ncbi:MAG: hypothetical protein QOH49_2821 [Acidobacteriota bacterium]|jgi:hypothetical protein|nr:hypothetical protein [Acidobacteriota bacterium]
MRVCVLLLTLTLAYGYEACGRAKLYDAAPALSSLSAPGTAQPAPSTTPPPRIDFNTQVRPLLESKCSPCHFAGGTMYQRLSFDRPETIEKLGTKLFTRIKDENEQRLIREFLAQQTEQGNDQP